MEVAPVVVLGDGRPQRLHLVDEHGARHRAGEIRMLEIGAAGRRVGRKRLAHRGEGLAGIGLGCRTLRRSLGTPQAAAPIEPELLVADTARVQEAEDFDQQVGVVLVAAWHQRQAT